MKCNKGLEVQVLKSAAGYYIGTMIEDKEMKCEVPNCQISVNYFRTEEKAKEAMAAGFQQRTCMENQYCAGARGCGIVIPKQSIGGIMVRKMIEQYEKGK